LWAFSYPEDVCVTSGVSSPLFTLIALNA